MFKALNKTIKAIFGTVVVAAVSVEKTFQLYENEVDNLASLQKERFKEEAQERANELKNLDDIK